MNRQTIWTPTMLAFVAEARARKLTVNAVYGTALRHRITAAAGWRHTQTPTHGYITEKDLTR